LLSKANLEGAPDKVTLVIDPLIDGVAGAQSSATHLEEKRVTVPSWLTEDEPIVICKSVFIFTQQHGPRMSLDF
jgi:hypothetical protein